VRYLRRFDRCSDKGCDRCHAELERLVRAGVLGGGLLGELLGELAVR